MRSLLIAILVLTGCGKAQPERGYTALQCQIIAIETSGSPVSVPQVDGVCPTCKGRGTVGDGTIALKCPTCDGTGRVKAPLGAIAPSPPVAVPPARPANGAPASPAKQPAGLRQGFARTSPPAKPAGNALPQAPLPQTAGKTPQAAAPTRGANGQRRFGTLFRRCFNGSCGR